MAATLSAACGDPPMADEDILRDGELPSAPRVTFPVAPSPPADGAAPDLVLVPGLSSPAAVWDRVVERMPRDARIHVAQLAGYAGAGPSSTRAGVLADATGELIAYLAACCPRGAVLVGHSLGGTIATNVAAARPDLVSHLVIVDARPSPGGPDNAGLLARRARGTRDGLLSANEEDFLVETRRQAAELFASDPDDVELIVQWSQTSHRPTVAQSLYELTLTDQRPLLKQIATPTTVLAGWHPDRPFSWEESVAYWNDLFATLPNGKVRLVRGARHFIMLDRPAELAAELACILEGAPDLTPPRC